MFKLIIISIFGLNHFLHAQTFRTIKQENALFKYAHKDSKLNGICTEIINAVSKENSQITFIGLNSKAPLMRIESMLNSNDIDLFFCLLKNEERIKFINFSSESLFKINHILLTIKKNSSHIPESYEELKMLSQKKPILVAQGSSLAQLLKNKGIKVDDGTRDEVSIAQKLIMGRGDYFYVQDLATREILEHLGISREDIVIGKKSFKQEEHFVAYSKKLSEQKINLINKAILDIKEKKIIDKILLKYKYQ